MVNIIYPYLLVKFHNLTFLFINYILTYKEGYFILLYSKFVNIKLIFLKNIIGKYILRSY